MANFRNEYDNTLLSGTSSNDSIWNVGKNVTISAGNGNDTVHNGYNGYGNANSVKIYTGAGNDYIHNDVGHSVTVDTGVKAMIQFVMIAIR